MDLKRNDLVYPELCYKIIGMLFDVYNELGPGYQEKYYQRAIAKAFEENGVRFSQQLQAPLQYRGKDIGKYFLDFLIEKKIVLEIKRGGYFPKANIQQIYAYLKATNKKLGILANFTNSEFKRIVNIEDEK